MKPAQVKVRPGFTAPPETAVLTGEQLAAWFQVSERQVDRLDWLPWVYVGGPRSKRCVVRDVLAVLHERAKKNTRAGLTRAPIPRHLEVR